MRAKPALVSAFLMIALTLVQRYFGIQIDPAIQSLFMPALALLLLVFFLLLVGAVIIAFFQYIAYEFMLDEHALKIRSGIINIEVEAVPFRQIQSVDVERDLLYRVIGISRLVIFTSATEDPGTGEKAEVVIPAIDKNVGYAIQEELLKRANIERVTFDQNKTF